MAKAKLKLLMLNRTSVLLISALIPLGWNIISRCDCSYFFNFLSKQLSQLHLLNPRSILYWQALISSLVIGWLFLLISEGKEAWRSMRRLLLSKDVLLSPSSLLDLKLYFFNFLIKPLIFFTALKYSIYIADFILPFLSLIFGNFKGIALGATSGFIIYNLMYFIAFDFIAFSHHWLLHNFKPFRFLHGVHHSAEVLTPLTMFRRHPLESIIVDMIRVFALGILHAIALYLFPSTTSSWSFLESYTLMTLFNFLGASLQHSSIPVSFGWLEYIFISPRMHQLHHSIESRHSDKNLGFALTIWDVLNRSFYRPTKEEIKNIKYGFHTIENDKEKREFLWAINNPIKAWIRSTKK